MDPLLSKIIYLIGYWIANFVIRGPHIRTHQKTPIRGQRNTRTDTFLFFATGISGFFIPLLYVFTPVLSFADYFIAAPVGVVGVIILGLGDWLFWKSHKDLGRNWSPTLDLREEHTLVTTGIYARIRHPMYTSLWLLVLSQALILPNYIAGFSGLLAFGALYFHRIENEERMMLEEFGDVYAQYIRRTGRLFPKLSGCRRDPGSLDIR